MKQIQFSFKDQNELDSGLTDLRTYFDTHKCYRMFIHIYTEIIDKEKIEKTLKRIEDVLPEADYVGCSSNGNILNGDFSGDSFDMSFFFSSFFSFLSAFIRSTSSL